MIKLTGLYLRISKKDGTEFLAGKVNPNLSLMLFKNRDRRSETDPEYIAYLVPEVQTARPKIEPRRQRESFFGSDQSIRSNGATIIAPVTDGSSRALRRRGR